MHLTRIEMTGFKSFADKTVIEFDRGMTAIVGPNGSGKSNLSEAIRWVLGEQSARSLRGDRMEDVIFNGTQARKPVNIARVTLVLNNEDRYLDYDYSEISISRSYNRNGDSTFMINNEVVRLKDIIDLLLDSGLGKNSFSIISQGQVEQIFLSKPEERRLIFEEAAGVQRYQHRKQEASRKLDRSQDNLNRVKDIIHELEMQLKPLSKQKDTAVHYNELSHQLKDLEISLYTKRIQTNQIELEALVTELNQIQNRIGDLNAEITKKQTENHQERERLTQLNQTIDEYMDEHQTHVQHLEQLKAEQILYQQQVDYAKQTTQSLEAQQNNLCEIITQLENNYQSTDRQIIEKETECALLSKQLIEIESRLSQLTQPANEALSSIQNNLIDAYQKQTMSNNDTLQLEKDIRQHQEQIKRLTRDQDELLKGITQSESETASIQSQIEIQISKIEVLESERDELNEQISEESINEENLRQIIFQHERLLNQKKSKYQYELSAQSNYEGYYSGVRAIMKAKSNLRGIVGPVAESIQVIPRYQLAIDTALGASAQHVIVIDDQTGKQAIQYLKQNSAGRATFLPRNVIKPRSIQASLINQIGDQPGFIGIASDLVDFNEEDAMIIQNILGTTIIVEDIDTGQRLAKRLNYKIRIVTLEGDVLMPGGAMTGGRQNKPAQSLLQRQQTISLLEHEIQSIITQFDELETQIDRIKSNRDQKQLTVLELEARIKDLNLKINQSNLTLEQKSNDLTRWLNQKVIIQDDITQAQKMILEMQSKLEESKRLHADASIAIDQLNQQMEETTRSNEERLEQKEALQKEQSQLSQDKAVIDTQLSQLKTLNRQLCEQLTDHKNQITNNTKKIKLERSNLVDLDKKIIELDELITNTANKTDTFPEELEMLRSNRDQLSLKIESIDEMVKHLQTELQNNYRLEARNQAKEERVRDFVGEQLSYLNETYQLTFEAAVQQAKPIDNQALVKQQVDELKKKINQLGPINIQAIDDFAELNERYQHLIIEQDDLLLAMQQLQTTIKQMDQQVKVKFKESFDQINEQFKKSFSHMFMGGSASLELTDPDDLLTTGIDIIAQPPGKKRQNLALLSGGERALTAIALLFAILEVRPVPFVILDEVEAALDDANVYRYGEYIQNFTLDTQFIVITHRKGTMENADVLYGVTMERSGVSKLASVKLSDAIDTLDN